MNKSIVLFLVLVVLRESRVMNRDPLNSTSSCYCICTYTCMELCPYKDMYLTIRIGRIAHCMTYGVCSTNF